MERDDEPLWFDNFARFSAELSKNFGEPDDERTAERELKDLRMNAGEPIASYNVRFQELSYRVKWGEPALVSMYRDGLALRVKRELSRRDEDEHRLNILMEVCTRIDTRHWEFQTDMDHSKNTSKNTSGNSSGSNNRQQSSSKPSSPSHQSSSSSSQSNNRSTPNTSSQSSRPQSSSQASSNIASNKSSSNNSSGSRPPLPNLTAEGRLNQSERQRRKDLNLCLYCGKHSNTIPCKLNSAKHVLRTSTTSTSSSLSARISSEPQSGN